MDRSWMFKDRRSREYEQGVEQFINFALLHASKPNSIRCPCLKCGNLDSRTPQVIRDHLFFNGIDQSYKKWIWHGEPASSDNPKIVKAQCEEKFDSNDVVGMMEMVQAAYEHDTNNPSKFIQLLKDAEQPLYPGCTRFTKLSGLVKLYNLKARFGWSDISFSALLELLVEMLPEYNKLPKSMYEAKKVLDTLGMGYEKIHACPNDCILYRKEYEEASSCPTCGASRWKASKNAKKKGKENPAKTLWYFPPIPRFQRMFQSAETAKNLTWHADKREIDGKLRHPADSPAWKLVDKMWPDFAAEARNLRLAISADGINPHRTLSSRYSCWPVMLITYNLPPWLCMKRKFMMLSLLISGPQQPGNDIDVFLAPLIEDLNTLWEVGVEAFDAYRQQSFNLRAILLWTINDFPAYGNLSGCTVKGYCACPICGEGTYSCRLKHGKKNSYTGHRRFLPIFHPYRRQRKAFNGEQEFSLAPEPLSGEEIYEKVAGIHNSWGKRRKSSGKHIAEGRKVWKKKSIFFDLKYWRYLHVRHNLDVMHIEKNVCESILGTLLNLPGKTKDGLNARLDLVEMGLRTELAPSVGPNRTYFPPACYTLSRLEKKRVCQTLFDLKVPEGYSSNFKNHVSMEDLKLYGLKSHDYHTLMQQLLPVAIRSVLPKNVRFAIIRLCFFFNELCQKVVDVSRLRQVQEDLVITLCLLEKYFPPSFFDIMIHLTVHLTKEVELCGPVYLRWMYPFERCMKVLKSYVRNRNHPEGCIAESYIAEEAVEFCTEYLSGVDAIGNHSNDGRQDGPLSSGCNITVSRQEWEQAHLYVLENSRDVQPYVDKHMDWIKNHYPRQSKMRKWIQDEHNRTFIYWLRQTVSDALTKQESISETLKWLAQGPRMEVLKYHGYVINGCCYHTKDRDNSRVHQNSGVSIVATTMQVSSAKDKNPIFGDMCFYGVIVEIWELDYYMFKIPMFKCDWVDSRTGMKVDDFGFTLVDLSKRGHKSDPFILASQSKQVFYVEDQLDPKWSVVLQTSTKEYKNHSRDDDDLNENSLEHLPFTKALPEVESFDTMDDSDAVHTRIDCDGTWIDNTSLN